MIHIVTGKINSGKSTMINNIYKDNQVGDGFISVKQMIDDKVYGYEIMKLSDQTLKLLVIRDEFYKENKEIECQIGPYLFIKETINYIESEIKEMIHKGVSPIYLDEIGQLELYDQCFHKIFSEIIQSNTDCVITVRTDLLDEVIDKYNLKDVTIKRV